MASRPGENICKHSSSHAKQSASSVWRETHQPFVHFLVASVAVLLWCSVKRHFIALLHWSTMILRAQMSSEADKDSSYSLFLTSVFPFSYISLTIIMANLLSWPLPPTPQISFSLALNLKSEPLASSVIYFFHPCRWERWERSAFMHAVAKW